MAPWAYCGGLRRLRTRKQKWKDKYRPHRQAVSRLQQRGIKDPVCSPLAVCTRGFGQGTYRWPQHGTKQKSSSVSTFSAGGDGGGDFGGSPDTIGSSVLVAAPMIFRFCGLSGARCTADGSDAMNEVLNTSARAGCNLVRN